MFTVITDKDIGEGLYVKNRKLKARNVLADIGMQKDVRAPILEKVEQLDDTIYPGNYRLLSTIAASDKTPFAGGDGSMFVIGDYVLDGKPNAGGGDLKQIAWTRVEDLYYRGVDETDGEGERIWSDWFLTITDANAEEQLKDIFLLKSKVVKGSDGNLRYSSPVIKLGYKDNDLSGKPNITWYENFEDEEPTFEHKDIGVYEFISPVPLRSDGEWVVDVPYLGGITPIVDYDITDEKLPNGEFKIIFKTFKQKLVQEEDEDGDLVMVQKRGKAIDIPKGYIMIHLDDYPEDELEYGQSLEHSYDDKF